MNAFSSTCSQLCRLVLSKKPQHFVRASDRVLIPVSVMVSSSTMSTLWKRYSPGTGMAIFVNDEFFPNKFGLNPRVTLACRS